MTRLSFGVLAASLVIIAASCADDDSPLGPKPLQDGGTSNGDASAPASEGGLPDDDGGIDGGDGAVPLPQFGACKPPDRTGMAFILEPAFHDLTFSFPVDLVEGPGKRFYVVEQSGAIKLVPPVGPATTVADLSDLIYFAGFGGEVGLLGLAFDPAFAVNGFAYVYFTANIPSGVLQDVLMRFTSKDGGLTFDRSTSKTILMVHDPFANHNGGHLAFGPDGMLYIGSGDGGSGGDPLGSGQDKNSWFGKILRINPTGGDPYSIPASNPFANGGGRPEIYAYGLRNPWKFSFDQLTGDLWCADVGQSAYEEIDRIVLGGNYGWNAREGKHCFLTDPCTSTGMIDPIAEYPHTEGVSVTGGFVYRGNKIPELKGKFIYGDFGVGNIWGVAAGETSGTLLMRTNANISTFGQDSDGEIYVADYATGAIKQLARSTSVPIAQPGSSLAATGCLDPKTPLQAPPTAIPYTVNSPLWADHSAQKDRWVFVHDGSKIGVGTDGDFDLPPASVAVKTFSVGGKKIETRLFARYGDGQWAGYSYAWADDQSDAFLLQNSKTISIGGFGPWYFPSPTDCFRCHTQAAGFTLGLEARQLNREENLFVDGGADGGDADGGDAGSPNVLDRFASYFVTPIVKSGFPSLGAADTQQMSAADRARGYLHANCSFCHRPGGVTGAATMDMRVDRTFLETKTCNASPQAGDLGVVNAKVIVPGAADKSLIPLRMRALDTNRMPPLATGRVDEVGSAAVEAWINGLTTCPP